MNILVVLKEMRSTDYRDVAQEKKTNALTKLQ